jgi:CDP-diacylglycerol--glycerol-3-phosphate 3-phosphatidyltransferase
MLSDILDGWIARTFNWTSRLGAILDSTGDVLVQLVAIGGLWIFYKETIFAHRVPVVIVVSLYLAELVIAVFRYGRISSFHTFLVRVAASALGIFVLSLFFWRYLDWIFYPAISLGVLAYSEELLILMLLAEWTPDVGGLYRAWMIAKRREYGSKNPGTVNANPFGRQPQSSSGELQTITASRQVSNAAGQALSVMRRATDLRPGL